jgi:hypothetical protein
MRGVIFQQAGRQFFAGAHRHRSMTQKACWKSYIGWTGPRHFADFGDQTLKDSGLCKLIIIFSGI